METPSAGSPYDPVRQQFLRQLHWYLGQITKEVVEETGENYDRRKRNDKFYNSIKFLADFVVKYNDGQEKSREAAASASAATSRTDAGDHASLRTSYAPNSSLYTQQQPQQLVNVIPQESELASLHTHAPLSRGRRLSEVQPMAGSIPSTMPCNISRPPVSVSPASALDVSFSIPSLQSSRAQSSESVPTVGGMSAPRSPAIANSARNNMNSTTTTANLPSTLQKSLTNFGFPGPQKRTASISSIHRDAISTTADIEASLATSGFLPPQRDLALSGQRIATRQSSGPHPTSSTGLSSATDMSDNNASHGRKRKRQKKQWCTLCNEHKEGFRGPHELQRHMNIQHQTKKTVFIVYDDSTEGNMFKNCKHCSRRKIYGQDYNAACHLRRAHFNKRLKTDTPEEREFKQTHPDFPPMEELRPWLRKCLVDVSKLRDRKYIDNQDEAILKVEAAVKHEDASSSDQDKDQEMSDDEPQPEGPATPPPESEDIEIEASQSTTQDATMGDTMINAYVDFDFDFGAPAPNAVDSQQPDFIFNSPPMAPPMQQQASTVPRFTNNIPAIFASQMHSMGISPERIIADKVPDFVGIDTNDFFGTSFDMSQFNSNSVETLGFDGNVDNFDIDQFLQG